MLTSTQLIERLREIEKQAGHAVYVAIDLSNARNFHGDELPDATEVITIHDKGKTEDTIAVIRFE